MGVQVALDSIAIEPGSIAVEGDFSYDPATQSLMVQGEEDSVRVCYRVLATVLTETYKQRDISGYSLSGVVAVREQAKVPIEKEELFDFEGIQKFGAISRGISFGNRQNVFVNSSLNLQMDGKVADNLFLSAVITDQNVPFQPEGNTQQIRDFDNVFLKLYNDKFDATAGDIVLQNEVPQDYFLRYYKNVQGLQLGYKGGQNGWKHRTKVSGSLAKGKFASTLLPAIEGLSGPYRLRGPNGERFIIILANSERVFLDGRQMQRGFDRDYIIDYNLGEITFNNHIVITQFSRIRVDFEYAEQFYSRSNFSFSQTVSKDNVDVYAGFYRERDNPNTNVGFVLSEDDLRQLAAIGDAVDQAFVTGFDTVEFDQNRILYRQVDTVDLDGNVQTIFQNSTDPTETLFSPTFSEVGEGNGDYLLVQTTSNGRVFEWVSPQGGIRQGRYQPGAFIPLPNSRQVINTGTEVKLNRYETVFSEFAFSSTDLNLYSPLDDEDNNGFGYHGGIRTAGRPSFLKNYQWSGSIAAELDNRDFTFIDRYRPIEFDRNWDLRVDTLQNVADNIIFSSLSLKKDEENEVGYSVNYRRRQDVFEGWQHFWVVDQELGGFNLNSEHSWLTTRQSQQVISSSWLQSRSDFSYQKWSLTPGYVFHIDENELSRQDSVLSTRMNFRSHEFYLANVDSSKQRYRISYTRRQDRFPVNGELRDYLLSNNINGFYQFSGRRSRVSVDANYRKVDDALGINTGQDELINGRINWWGNYLNKSLLQNFSLSTGNSRELRREFVYLPVAAGEGTHTWRDLNGDGVQDLNEFFEAINADERNFAKIFTPTDEYITSFQTFYVHTLDLKAPFSWRGRGGALAMVSKLSANINFNVNYRTVSEDLNKRLNPFSVKLDDEDLLAVQDLKRYTLFFNRNGRGFAADIGLLNGNQKQLLTQGFESRQRDEWITNLKIDLNSEYTIRISSTLGNLLNASDFLESRNFDIVTSKYEPQLIWQPTRNFRFIGSYEMENNNNEFLETSNESSRIQRYKAELTWNQATKGSLRGQLSWIRIDFEGDPNTYLAYLLLDALQPGTNQTWQLTWQQKLARGMQLSLLYNGRKSENQNSIHTGSVQLTAFF